MRQDLSTVTWRYKSLLMRPTITRAEMEPSPYPTPTLSNLTTTVGGTAFPVFIPGLHAPDDTEVARIVL